MNRHELPLGDQGHTHFSGLSFPSSDPARPVRDLAFYVPSFSYQFVVQIRPETTGSVRLEPSRSSGEKGWMGLRSCRVSKDLRRVERVKITGHNGKEDLSGRQQVDGGDGVTDKRRVAGPISLGRRGITLG